MSQPGQNQLLKFSFSPEGLFPSYLEIYSNKNALKSRSESLFSLRKRTHAGWRMGKEVGKKKDIWIFASVNMNDFSKPWLFWTRNVFSF